MKPVTRSLWPSRTKSRILRRVESVSFRLTRLHLEKDYHSGNLSMLSTWTGLFTPSESPTVASKTAPRFASKNFTYRVLCSENAFSVAHNLCASGGFLQIHTHMCYSHFNDIIHSIIDMDADVITIENSRSDEKLLSVFREGVKYGAGIGPGVYDIHSPRIPSSEEIADRVNKMLAVLEQNILWVNPDCGLKTRKYTEVKPALKNMVDAAKLIRSQLASAK